MCIPGANEVKLIFDGLACVCGRGLNCPVKNGYTVDDSPCGAAFRQQFNTQGFKPDDVALPHFVTAAEQTAETLCSTMLADVAATLELAQDDASLRQGLVNLTTDLATSRWLAATPSSGGGGGRGRAKKQEKKAGEDAQQALKDWATAQDDASSFDPPLAKTLCGFWSSTLCQLANLQSSHGNFLNNFEKTQDVRLLGAFYNLLMSWDLDTSAFGETPYTSTQLMRGAKRRADGEVFVFDDDSVRMSTMHHETSSNRGGAGLRAHTQEDALKLDRAGACSVAQQMKCRDVKPCVALLQVGCSDTLKRGALPTGKTETTKLSLAASLTYYNSAGFTQVDRLFTHGLGIPSDDYRTAVLQGVDAAVKLLWLALIVYGATKNLAMAPVANAATPVGLRGRREWLGTGLQPPRSQGEGVRSGGQGGSEVEAKNADSDSRDQKAAVASGEEAKESDDSEEEESSTDEEDSEKRRSGDGGRGGGGGGRGGGGGSGGADAGGGDNNAECGGDDAPDADKNSGDTQGDDGGTTEDVAGHSRCSDRGIADDNQGGNADQRHDAPNAGAGNQRGRSGNQGGGKGLVGRNAARETCVIYPWDLHPDIVPPLPQPRQPLPLAEALKVGRFAGVVVPSHRGTCNGAFARVLHVRGTFDGKPTDAVVKLQAAKLHVRELHALVRLTGVPGVVRLLDVVRCQDGLGLVLGGLEDVAYGTIKKDVNKVALFATSASSILASVHSNGVAHCDVKPEAFMRRPGPADDYVLVDFNLADEADRRLNARDSLCGTPGWVLLDSPHRTPADTDCIGLATLVSWLLRLRFFGEPGYQYVYATMDVAGAVRREEDVTRRALLLGVQSLLGLGGGCVKALELFREAVSLASAVAGRGRSLFRIRRWLSRACFWRFACARLMLRSRVPAACVCAGCASTVQPTTPQRAPQRAGVGTKSRSDSKPLANAGVAALAPDTLDAGARTSLLQPPLHANPQPARLFVSVACVGAGCRGRCQFFRAAVVVLARASLLYAPSFIRRFRGLLRCAGCGEGCGHWP
jgi:hypothetical protein